MALQAVNSNGRAVPVERTPRRKTTCAHREAADRLFGKPTNANAPRILEDVSKVRADERIDRIVAGKPAATAVALVMKDETEHEKVFRLVGDRKFEEAAKVAARLINAGNAEGFFIYGSLATYRRAEQWFEDSVKTTRRTAASMIQNVTPELAQVLLLKNDGNRKVKAANLARLMRDIIDDRWHLNGESMIVAKDGSVNDGQHRNFAVLLTGRTVKTVMSFGLSRDSMKTVDIGEKRQAKDRLGIAGVSDYIRMSAIASMAFETYNGRAATPPEADDYFHEHRSLIERAGSLTSTNMKGVGPAAAGVAAMHLIRMGFDDADIRAFFAKIRSGEMLSKNDPRMTLHRAIFVDRYKLKLSRDNWFRAIVNHFLALKEGRKPTEVQFAKSVPGLA